MDEPQPDSWTSVGVTAPDHDAAVRKAQQVARQAGDRIRAVGDAQRTGRSSGTSRSHRWAVQLLLTPAEADHHAT